VKEGAAGAEEQVVGGEVKAPGVADPNRVADGVACAELDVDEEDARRKGCVCEGGAGVVSVGWVVEGGWVMGRGTAGVGVM